MTAIKCLGGLVVMMLARLVRGWVWLPAEAQNFVRLLMVTYSTYYYIWWAICSPSLKCMRTWFLLGGVNVTVIKCLGGLVVWCLPSQWEAGVRLPIEAQNIFSDRVTYSTRCYINFCLFPIKCYPPMLGHCWHYYAISFCITVVIFHDRSKAEVDDLPS